MSPENAQAVALANDIKGQLKDPAKLFGLVIRFQLREGMEQKFEATFAKAIAATRKEAGVVRYELNRDAKDATCYFLNERWKDWPALQTHLEAPYIANLLTEITPMLAAAPEMHVVTPAAE
jgi:quinol monooxygenase YgiN